MRAGRDVVVVGPELLLERVGEVEGPVVRAPARAVGADDAVLDLGDAQVRVEAIQPADLELLLVVHPAGEEPATAVALAVVQPGARLIGLDELDAFQAAALEVEEVEAVVQGKHGAAVAAQRQRSDVVVERPVLGAPGARIESPDAGVAHPPSGAVHPVEAALVHIPDRSFAQVIAAFEHALDPVRHADATFPPAAASVLRGRL